MNGLLSAELIRWRRSNASLLLILAALFSCFSAVIAVLNGGSRWDSYLASIVVWGTGAAQPAAAVLMGLVNQRDLRARWGGSQWRPTSARARYYSRYGVVVIAILLMNIVVALPPLIAGSLSVPGHVPVDRFALLAVLLTVGACVLLPLYDLMSRHWGLIPPIVLSGIWMVTGVLSAERNDWEFIPPAWSIRALLPLLGTHANGVALDASDPINSENPLQATLLTLLFGLLIFVMSLTGMVIARRLLSRMKRSTHVHRGVGPSTERFHDLPTGQTTRTHPRVWHSQTLSMGRTLIPWIMVIGLFLQLGVWATWGSTTNYTAPFLQLIVIPLDAIALGILGWDSQSTALRSITTRTQSVAKLTTIRLIILWMGTTVAMLLGSIFLLLAHVGTGTIMRTILLGAAVGWMLLTFSYWNAAQWGSGTAYAIQGAGFILSLVTGTGSLGPTLWPISPWAWVYEPTRMSWAITIIIMMASVIIGILSLHQAIKASHNHMIQ